MPGVDLVVTDLDGTFWTGHHLVHPTAIAAWHELERRGVEVMVATGRRVTSTRTPLDRLGLRPAAAVMNGALVLDLDTDERFHHHAHDADAARTILDAFRAEGIEPCVYVDDPECAVLVGEQASTHPEHLATLRGEARIVDLDVHIETATVLMFGVMGLPPAGLAAVATALEGIGTAHVATGDQWGGHTCTVTPLGLSKWVGVTRYCEARGIDPARTLAIGDGPNDVELLRGAGIAVAPTNGVAEALAAADHVVSPSGVGGWAEILDLV